MIHERGSGYSCDGSNLTFTDLLQAIHNSKSKFALREQKNRYAVFFHAVFRHFLPACLSLMPKNRPCFRKAPQQFHAKNGQP
jgi:hypothetical protein